MNAVQFDALAGLLRLRDKSSSSKALRMVLVEGVPLDVAAAACLIEAGHVEVVLKSAKRALERAQLLHGVSIP